jgi:hypothetical protein
MSTSDGGPRGEVYAERLLTLSSAAKRITDLVAVAQEPVNYAVLRHLLRVSEETMTEVLDEAVHASLVRRGSDPFTYVPHDDATGAAIAEWIDVERAERMRAQIRRVKQRVFE